ncbi:MAG: OB-fold nucleic acid binding domain-containing protein, partial [Desulfosalsimonadaceae bacterium]|nr:OB-fold nucleic acid binding domain-containing protein [Desulfosalsimonadaceae bacterium]
MSQTKDVISDVVEKRKEKIRALQEAGAELFPNDYRVSHTVEDVQKIVDGRTGDISQEVSVSMAGRMMAVNLFGKSAFIRFRDRTGQLQAYVRTDKVGASAYAVFKKLDIGDFVGITGGLFQTKTGEWTLLADSIRLLSKAMRPLPEKFHGLKDPEKRYRQRYLDLIMNGDVRELFIKRFKMVQ